MRCVEIKSFTHDEIYLMKTVNCGRSQFITKLGVHRKTTVKFMKFKHDRKAVDECRPH
jgi:hypothetical protein